MPHDLIEPAPPRGRTRSAFQDDDSDDYGGLPADGGGTATRPTGWPQEWMDEVVAELRDLLDLPEDWDSYGASPVSRRSCDRAVAVVKQLACVMTARPEAYATPDGTAEISWEWGPRTPRGGRFLLELEFLLDGRIRYAFLDRTDREAAREATARGWAEWIDFLPLCGSDAAPS